MHHQNIAKQGLLAAILVVFGLACDDNNLGYARTDSVSEVDVDPNDVGLDTRASHDTEVLDVEPEPQIRGPFPMFLLVDRAPDAPVVLRAFDQDGDGQALTDDEVVVFYRPSEDGITIEELAPWKEDGLLFRTDRGGLWLIQDADGDGKADSETLRELGVTGGGSAGLTGGPVVGADGWVYLFNQGGAGERFFFRKQPQRDSEPGELLWNNFALSENFSTPWMAVSSEHLVMFELEDGKPVLISLHLETLQRQRLWDGSRGENIGALATNVDATTIVLMQPNLGYDLVVLNDQNNDGMFAGEDERRVLIFAAGSSSIVGAGLGVADNEAFFVWDRFNAENAVVYAVELNDSDRVRPVVTVPEGLELGDRSNLPSRVRAFAMYR